MTEVEEKEDDQVEKIALPGSTIEESDNIDQQAQLSISLERNQENITRVEQLAEAVQG